MFPPLSIVSWTISKSPLPPVGDLSVILVPVGRFDYHPIGLFRRLGIAEKGAPGQAHVAACYQLLSSNG